MRRLLLAVVFLLLSFLLAMVIGVATFKADAADICNDVGLVNIQDYTGGETEVWVDGEKLLTIASAISVIYLGIEPGKHQFEICNPGRAGCFTFIEQIDACKIYVIPVLPTSMRQSL